MSKTWIFRDQTWLISYSFSKLIYRLINHVLAILKFCRLIFYVQAFLTRGDKITNLLTTEENFNCYKIPSTYKSKNIDAFRLTCSKLYFSQSSISLVPDIAHNQNVIIVFMIWCKYRLVAFVEHILRSRAYRNYISTKIRYLMFNLKLIFFSSMYDGTGAFGN